MIQPRIQNPVLVLELRFNDYRPYRTTLAEWLVYVLLIPAGIICTCARYYTVTFGTRTVQLPAVPVHLPPAPPTACCAPGAPDLTA